MDETKPLNYAALHLRLLRTINSRANTTVIIDCQLYMTSARTHKKPGYKDDMPGTFTGV
jgi:hypothetical protein